MKTFLFILRKTLSINTLIVVLCLVIYSIGVNATVRYVKPIASGMGDGSSWDNASPDIQTMIDISIAGDSIWVAAGEYKPNTYPIGCTNCIDSRDYLFHVKNGVKLFGNFNGTETDITQRDFGTNTTFLSGDLNDDDVVNSSFIDLEIIGTTDNIYHVILIFDPSPVVLPVTIDGFTIKGGNANGTSYYSIAGTTVMKYRGGGILIENAPTTITNCFIVNNTASAGGGVYNYNQNLVISNSIIANNVSNTFGGGIAFWSPLGEIKNNSFIGNKSITNGGAISCSGTECEITNNEIIGNVAITDGGGLSINNGKGRVHNNIIINNYAVGNGGAIIGSIGTGVISNNIIAHNIAGNSGGGLVVFPNSNLVINNVIYNNVADMDGGGIYILLGINNFINNTIVYNNANNNGGGIYLNEGLNTFINNILWDNRLNTEANINSADLYLNTISNIFQNNILQLDSTFYAFPNYYLGSNPQGNLFAQDPNFVNIFNEKGEDQFYFTDDDGLRLRENSPALNAGTLTDAPETDILGTFRDILPDIGAYENGVFVGIYPNTGSTPTATLHAYPNPATDKITFTFTIPTTDYSTLLLYAIDGQNITTLYKATTQAGQTNTLTIDTKAFTPGTYCAVLRCGNGLAQHRTIIIK